MSAFAVVQNLDVPIRDPALILVCDTFASRLRGLMFRPSLSRTEGMLLVGDRDSRLDAAIHMLFVRFDLAVFWIEDGMTVVDKVLARAWRPAYVPARPARYVLEVHPDLYSAYAVGHKVQVIHV